MALKRYNPTSPGQRGLILVDRSELHKGKPEKSLVEGLHKSGGRGGGGRIAVRFRGGGAKVFGPVVRSHEVNLTKKMRALGLRHALSSKALSGSLVVMDTFALDSAKTAPLKASLGKMGLTSALVICGPEVDGNLKLAARNIPHLDVLPSAGLNVYDILRRDTLVLTRAAVDAIAARFADKEAA